MSWKYSEALLGSVLPRGILWNERKMSLLKWSYLATMRGVSPWRLTALTSVGVFLSKLPKTRSLRTLWWSLVFPSTSLSLSSSWNCDLTSRSAMSSALGRAAGSSWRQSRTIAAISGGKPSKSGNATAYTIWKEATIQKQNFVYKAKAIPSIYITLSSVLVVMRCNVSETQVSDCSKSAVSGVTRLCFNEQDPGTTGFI